MGHAKIDYVPYIKVSPVNDSHGREGKVFVWQFKEDEEHTFDRGLPAEGGTRRKPWLLHSLDVKEMMFCGIDIACVDDVCLLPLSITHTRVLWLLRVRDR